jgi:hypothetical protein
MFHLGRQLAETYFRFCVFSLHTKRFNIQISVRGAKIAEENFSILPNIYVNTVWGYYPHSGTKCTNLSSTWGNCVFSFWQCSLVTKGKDVISLT